MIENEFKGTTSSEDSDADMAECSNGFDEATHDQGKIFNPFSIAEGSFSLLRSRLNDTE